MASLSPLSQSAVDNDVEKIKTLIDQGANVNEVHKIRPHIGTTALSDAVELGNHNAVKTLLELGANPNIYSTLYAETPTGLHRLNGSPLMQAVLEEDIKIVEMLLKAGADANAIAGETKIDSSPCYDPLGFSAITGNSDIARLLLKYGANSNRKYKNGSKAAYEALHRGYIDYVIVLVENGLEIESDPQYMHYNAELAHIAADYYSSSNEEKALQLYKQAIEFYPHGVKNYEQIADGIKRKEYGKWLLSVVVIASKYYDGYHYGPNMDSEKYYRSKAKNSERNYNLCKTILNCYEENKPDITLVDCVKNAGGNYKKLEAKGGEELKAELNGSA